MDAFRSALWHFKLTLYKNVLRTSPLSTMLFFLIFAPSCCHNYSALELCCWAHMIPIPSCGLDIQAHRMCGPFPEPVGTVLRCSSCSFCQGPWALLNREGTAVNRKQNLKEGEGAEKVLSSCSLNICPSYKHFPPTPCFVHRVDTEPPVFGQGILLVPSYMFTKVPSLLSSCS